MIKEFIFSLLSALSILIFSTSIIVVALFFTRQIDSEKVSLKRVFPFEVVNYLKAPLVVYYILLFAFGISSLLPLFQIFNDLNFYENLRPIILSIGFVSLLGAIIFIFINFFNPTDVKQHLTLVTIFTVLVSVNGILIFSNSLLTYKISIDLGIDSIKNLIIGALALCLSCVEIISIFTFNLKSWAKLEKNEDILKRPKFFPLAAFEWLSFILLSIEEILFLLSIIKY